MARSPAGFGSGPPLAAPAIHTGMLVWGRQSTGFFGSGHCFHSYCFDLLRYAGLRPSISRTRSSASPCIRSSAHGSQPRFRLHGNGLRWNGPISVSVLGPSIAPVTSTPRARQSPSQALRTAPSGIRPVSTNRHNATISLRATATIAIRRKRPCVFVTRSRYQMASRLSG
jgi:hypothetical protein